MPKNRPNERAFKRAKETTQNKINRKRKKRKRKIKEIKRGRMREHLKEPWRPPKYNKIEKERGSNTTIIFTTLVLVVPTLHCREFSCCFSSTTIWGSFHYRTWLAYSKDEPTQVSSRSS